jgi:Mn-dependent DtxR family transcriptional regulator
MEQKTNLEETLLHYLSNSDSIADTGTWAKDFSVKHDAVVGVVKKLEALEIVQSKILEKKVTELTEEGEEIVKLGSPEIRTFHAIPK